MTRFTTTTTALAALMATTTIAHAGGFERSGFNISPLFEEGTYAEMSFSFVSPDVSGTAPAFGNTASGNMSEDYFSYGFAYRTDLTDSLSLAVIFNDAFGADISYENSVAGFPFRNFNASLSGRSASALLRYEIDDTWSVHGGLRYVVMDAQINFLAGGNVGPAPIAANQTIDYESDGAFGYTIGGSYEIPDIALRASLTYQSETTHDNTIVGAPTALGPGAASTGSYTLPQSLLLDFQTGIAENTLLLASVQWTDWSETELNTQSAVGVIEYDDDVYTYSVGVARRLNEQFAVLGRLTYEAQTGSLQGNLGPTDGRLGLALAGIYTMGDVTLTGGINYTMLGDATTRFVGNDFSDNSALGVGLRVGYNF
ncbi:hypothetical protein A8B78_17790 [Jannaschia sp. EhC01]|nr:hypothetical protein A8B78_17790 [Jannaschia sp. EhC01]